MIPEGIGLWGWMCIILAAISAVITLWYLLKRPPLTVGTKLALLLGVLIFPGLAGLSGNAAGLHATMQRPFCGSCHVMEPWTDDSNDPESTSLASRHARNKWFGNSNCYTCHADYRALGPVLTKMNGMLHVWHYVKSFRDMPIEEAIGEIHIYKPYSNRNCEQCHSTRTSGWMGVADHEGAVDEIRSGDMSCASDGCHGPAHPFSKKAKE